MTSGVFFAITHNFRTNIGGLSLKKIDDKLLRKAQLKMLDVLLDIDRVCREHSIPYWLECGTLLGAVRHKGFIPWDDDIDIAMLRDDFNTFNERAQESLGSRFFVQNEVTDKYYFKRNFPCKVRLNNSFFEEQEYSLLAGNERKGHFGIFVDVFPVDRYSKYRIFREFQRFLSKVVYAKTISVYKRHNSIFKSIPAALSNFISWRLINKWKLFQTQKNKGELLGFGVEMPFTMGYVDHDMIFPLKEIRFEGHCFFVPNNFHKVLVTRYGENYMDPPPLNKRVWHAVSIEL
jgi:lipopolysaccharide cholinephosphotransferase